METLLNTVCGIFYITCSWYSNGFVADWVMSKGNILNTNDTLIMTLTESNGGTLLSSTRYVHYGTITTKRAHITHILCLYTDLDHSQDRTLGRCCHRIHHNERHKG